MNLDDVLPSFIAEATELLREMESGLLECTHGHASAETINLIFRTAHTIKGSAGLFGLEPVVTFVHGVETLLDRVRLGDVKLDEALVGRLLSCKDHIGVLIGAVMDPVQLAQPAYKARGDELLSALVASASKVSAPADSAAASTDAWHLSMRFGPDVLTSGMDPISFIRYLASFGSIKGLVVVDDALAPLAEMDAERNHLGFELALETSEPREKIEGAFEFVRDDLRLQLLPPHSAPAQYFEVLRATGLDDARIASLLYQCGSLTAVEIEKALRTPIDSPVADAPVEKSLASQPIESASDGAKSPRPASNDPNATIRVDANKLDTLITRIGELIIAAAGAQLAARRSGNSELGETISTLSSLVEEVRGSALQLRMVKIGGTFNRFQRVVHDVSRELGKEIQLVVNGEDAELDKTVVERIADPLTHLVRNAIDHGIESADVRAARGKPAVGTLSLNAFHDSGSIVIEVSDDGGGLKRQKILDKAIERGLIEPDRLLSDSEIFALIFEPGFSTADQVTNLSGRGVGMDVVKRNITALRGAVSIRSTEGVGTTVTVRLPLTLAIINGFQISLGNSIYVLPLDSIEECVEFSASPGHDFTSLRGELLPFIRLRDLFDTKMPPARRQSIVVVRHAGQRAGLVVDSLLGESQTVIKPLGKMFRQVECVSGSSVLGTGDVALILDVSVLVRQAVQRGQSAQSAAGRDKDMPLPLSA
jgi:two-component system chemotaxis sensor kinase CheA